MPTVASRICFPLLFAGIIHFCSVAQCSDAGACSLARQNPDPSHEFSLTYQFGKSSKTEDLTFHTLQLSAAIRIFNESRCSILMPLNRQSGPLGSVAGPGDLLLIWNQSIARDAAYHLSFQVGGKLATAATNAANLPQAYQSGLGTNDLLLGASADYLEWGFVIVYQFSPGRSANRIDRLRRGDDLLVKAGYLDAFGDLKLGVELLAIKRLHESSVLDSLSGGQEVFGLLAGSDQTQVNLLGRAEFPITAHYSARGMAAIPLLRRNINVDGLTRSLSLSLALAYSF